MVWTTVAKVPLTVVGGNTGLPGGDSLGIGHRAIWLTNYDVGTISRIDMDDALHHCKGNSAELPRVRGED